MSSPPPECANCGAALPARAKSCPECGADERTGWRETDLYDGIDLADEAWGENPEDSPPPPRELPWYWWAAGMGILLAFVGAVLGLT